jgi:anti-sigma regulatory factor (Ser/Thr protein kinase)
MSAAKVEDLVLATHELATNSLRHADGRGVLRVWRDAGAMICEVRDSGHIDEPLVGRDPPSSGQVGGFGMWLAHQLCDLVQIRSFAHGSAVRLHMRVA